MGRGIIGLAQLAVALAFAAPVALLGLQLLGRGETLMGGGLLVIAAGMLAIEEYVTTPGDVPGMVAKRVVGSVAKQPDDEE